MAQGPGQGLSGRRRSLTNPRSPLRPHLLPRVADRLLRVFPEAIRVARDLHRDRRHVGKHARPRELQHRLEPDRPPRRKAAITALTRELYFCTLPKSCGGGQRDHSIPERAKVWPLETAPHRRSALLDRCCWKNELAGEILEGSRCGRKDRAILAGDLRPTRPTGGDPRKVSR